MDFIFICRPRLLVCEIAISYLPNSEGRGYTIANSVLTFRNP